MAPLFSLLSLPRSCLCLPGEVPDGAEFFYFPVLLIGHGVLGPVTGVIYDKKTGSAAVVQAELLQMCGEQFGKDFQDSAFCTDPRGALKRVAQAIRQNPD